MKTLFLILTCLILASCSQQQTIIEFPNGQRASVEYTEVYEVGDTVCVASSNVPAQSLSRVYISTTYWKDTIVTDNIAGFTRIIHYQMGKRIK